MSTEPGCRFVRYRLVCFRAICSAVYCFRCQVDVDVTVCTVAMRALVVDTVVYPERWPDGNYSPISVADGRLLSKTVGFQYTEWAEKVSCCIAGFNL